MAAAFVAPVSGYVTWPYENSMTPAALAHVETAVRQYREQHMPNDSPVSIELLNLANELRAYLQHYVEQRRTASAVDPLLE